MFLCRFERQNHGPVVRYTDSGFGIESQRRAAFGHLLLVPNPDHNRSGDFGLDGERVTLGGGEMWTYSGIALLDPRLFARAAPGKFPLAPLLIEAMASDAITGEIFRGRWVDVGTPERLQALDRELGSLLT